MRLRLAHVVELTIAPERSPSDDELVVRTQERESERIGVGYLLCDGNCGSCSLLQPYSVAVHRLVRSPPEARRVPAPAYPLRSSLPRSRTTKPTAPPLWMWPCSGAELLDGSQPAIPARSLAGERRQVCRTDGLGR